MIGLARKINMRKARREKEGTGEEKREMIVEGPPEHVPTGGRGLGHRKTIVLGTKWK